MKVILTKNVPKVGKEGDIMNVADGYARNFLLPRSLAVPADESHMKQMEKRKEILMKKADAIKVDAEKVKEKLDGQIVTIKHKTGKNTTKLFGAITPSHIAEAILSQHQINVDKRHILLINPIKSTGEFEVPIHLHHEVNVNIKVIVDAEETA